MFNFNRNKNKAEEVQKLGIVTSDNLHRDEYMLPSAVSAINATVKRFPVEPARGSFFSRRITWSRRIVVVFSVVSAVLLFGASITAYSQYFNVEGSYEKRPKPKFEPKIVTVPNLLTGLPVDPSVNQRPILGVMIENSEQARPQSGLDGAGIVFEAIAEGGITRFLALYQDPLPESFGPVRSARPYYVQWCMSFDCALAHVGGSPEAIANIRSWNTKDLDQFQHPGSFIRNNDQGRYAPHNMYTNSNALLELAAAKGYGAPTVTAFTRKAEAPSKAANATTITVNISSFAFNSSYAYDKPTNSFKRSQASKPHMVLGPGGQEVQLQPKNLVVLHMQYGVAADKHSLYNSVGSGSGIAFFDGIAHPINWAKSDIATPLILTNPDGTPLALNPGQTWITAVSSPTLVSHQ